MRRLPADLQPLRATRPSGLGAESRGLALPDVRPLANALIEGTAEPWMLVPADALDPELPAAVRAILLERGGLTRADALALRGAVLKPGPSYS